MRANAVICLRRIVREALERELRLTEQEEEPIPPPLNCIGVISSGRSDLSRMASEDIFEPEPFR